MLRRPVYNKENNERSEGNTAPFNSYEDFVIVSITTFSEQDYTAYGVPAENVNTVHRFYSTRLVNRTTSGTIFLAASHC